MNRIIIAFFSLLFSGIQAQTSSEVIDSFFEALNAKDQVTLKRLCLDDMQLHSLSIAPDRTLSSQSIKDFTDQIQSLPEEVAILEKIHSKESIETEFLAQYTLGYSFFVNGEFSHSGTNVMTLINTEEGWKISYVADTRKPKS
ncbi:DUF4829 domain-containing protein [Psychroflexus tropicus]|uniref:DUF4829 domain-containing protein n=1 Tax=Psychroflexus tropicus TaxID=197345 RepID=UPI0003790ACF|nr:DUF4829 domain-containing protein [Psychroflexus tropicus]